jgi:hypothetical protein
MNYSSDPLLLIPRIVDITFSVQALRMGNEKVRKYAYSGVMFVPSLITNPYVIPKVTGHTYGRGCSSR